MENDVYKMKYEHLVKKVNEMLDCQQAYFKSKKDFQLLKKSKAIKQEVRDICNPKPPKQQSMFSDEFLGK